MPKLNKTQKRIILIAGALLLIAWNFPPYYYPDFNDKGEITGTKIKWEFNKYLRDIVNPPLYKDSETGWTSIIVSEYADVPWLIRLEIFGILILAGAALLITKKR